jgi:hypothetical protein
VGALRFLHRVAVQGLSASEQLVLLATCGLVQSRAGSIERGRELYLAAIARARTRSMSQSDPKLLALFNLAEEELLAGTARANTTRKEALAVLSKMETPDMKAIERRLMTLHPSTRAAGD